MLWSSGPDSMISSLLASTLFSTFKMYKVVPASVFPTLDNASLSNLLAFTQLSSLMTRLWMMTMTAVLMRMALPSENLTTTMTERKSIDPSSERPNSHWSPVPSDPYSNLYTLTHYRGLLWPSPIHLAIHPPPIMLKVFPTSSTSSWFSPIGVVQNLELLHSQEAQRCSHHPWETRIWQKWRWRTLCASVKLLLRVWSPNITNHAFARDGELIQRELKAKSQKTRKRKRS